MGGDQVPGELKDLEGGAFRIRGLSEQFPGHQAGGAVLGVVGLRRGFIRRPMERSSEAQDRV